MSDAARIRQRCEDVLWDPIPQGDELSLLVEELEAYVGLLAPKVEELVPRMREGMQDTARIVLRHSGEVLDDTGTTTADLGTRLYNAGVIARALLGLLERPGELDPSPGPSRRRPWGTAARPEE
ncbi:DUF6415 family natural product biosynthesis protein [Streptomyces sp. NPDC012474]|uniref:DUF6415 family natural product biosynthesis protein n=1 Tax=Streptomyces sp. NPDC012474 TaxID=3364836 RepID=UPI0036F12C20